MATNKAGARADETRTRLLSSAVECFAAKGFHGTSTRDIARHAGISPTLLYVHHDSKEELLYLISRSGHDEALRVVREAVDGNPGPRAQLVGLVRAFVLHHALRHTASRVANFEMAALSPEHFDEIAGVRRRITDTVRAVVDDGILAGVFNPPDRRMAVTAVISLGVDLSRWYKVGAYPPEAIADAYAEMALRFMSPLPPAEDVPIVHA